MMTDDHPSQILEARENLTSKIDQPILDYPKGNIQTTEGDINVIPE